MTVTVRPLPCNYSSALRNLLRCVTLQFLLYGFHGRSGELVFTLASRRKAATLNLACLNKL